MRVDKRYDVRLGGGGGGGGRGRGGRWGPVEEGEGVGGKAARGGGRGRLHNRQGNGNLTLPEEFVHGRLHCCHEGER